MAELERGASEGSESVDQDGDEVELELPPATLLPDGVMSEIDVSPEGLCIKYLNVPAGASVQVSVYALLAMQSLRRVFQDELESEEASEIVGPGGDGEAEGTVEEEDGGSDEPEAEVRPGQRKIHLRPIPSSAIVAQPAGETSSPATEQRVIRIRRSLLRERQQQQQARRRIGFQSD